MITGTAIATSIATYCATHPVESGVVINLLSSGVLHAVTDTNKEFNAAMNRCFKKALKKWCVNADIRRVEERKQWQHYEELKVYLQKGASESLDRGTLNLICLWIDEINSDADCRAIIEQLKIEELLNESREFGDMMLQMQETQQEIAQGLEVLLQKGVRTGEEYWRALSVYEGGNRKLPTSIITRGRENAKQELMAACYEPSNIVLEAQSRREAMAFAVATIVEEGSVLIDQTFVAEEKDAYETILKTEKTGIIITTVSANHVLAKDKGFSVVYCVAIQDRCLNLDLKLPEIDREGFVTSLVQSGFDDTQSRQMALDCAEDVNILWRMLGIVTSAPLWESADAIRTLVPAMMVVQWNEDYPNDKERIAVLAGEDYNTYQRKLQALSMMEECPLTKVGSVWCVKSPYAMMKKYYGDVSDADRKAFLECIDWVMEDDDPEVMAKYAATELQFWNEKRAYSNQMREGVLQGLALIALMEEGIDCKHLNVERWVGEKLKSFGIERYLSNRSCIKWLAEAAPKAILRYIGDDISNGSPVMEKVFKVKKVSVGLTDTEIFYSELLFCLESMAWDEHLLSQVTEVLLNLCAYKNDSNWGNKPINSLAEIYRFFLPQTYATMAVRVEILSCLAKRYPKQVREVCVRMLHSVSDSFWNVSAHFQWRWMERRKDTKYFNQVYQEDIRKVYELLLSVISWSVEDMKTLLDISIDRKIDFLRADILNDMREHKAVVCGNEDFVEELRKQIHRHKTCPEAKWSLKGEDLQQYKDLLHSLEPEDVILCNKHYFESIFYCDPELGIDYHNPDTQVAKTKKLRADIVKQILDARGLDGLWNLVAVVKAPAAVADGLVELEGDLHHREIYQRYADGQLCEEFTRCYFSRLYYRGTPEEYSQHVAELSNIAPEYQAILLYAPDFKRELAEVAENAPELVRNDYWKNVRVCMPAMDEARLIITRFMRYKRFFDTLQVMVMEGVLDLFTNVEKIDVLFEMWQKGGLTEMMRESYQVARVLETIEMPESQEERTKLVLIEFTLQEYLSHYLKDRKNHLWCLVNEDPEMLHQIVETAFKSDEGEPKELDETQQEMARLAWNYIYHFKSSPCMREDGSIDEERLRVYIQNYISIAKERKYENVWPIIVGKIIGNLPEGDEYPSDFMCEMVEELNNDTIDTEVSCCISNRRSMSTRSPFEGGTIERKHVETLSKYLERASKRSPRMSRILEREIDSYKYLAQREDDEARMNRLRY